MRAFLAGVALLALAAGAEVAAGQSVLDRSPNLQGVWGLDPGRGAFIFAHRFEVLSGGDELVSIPTLTLAAGLPAGLTAGIDFTSLSEAIPASVTGNEAQFWLKRPVRISNSFDVAPLLAYNTAAKSVDGAIDVRYAVRRFQLFAEGRAFSDLFGAEGFQAGGAVGGALRLTEFLSLTGDIGKVLTLSDVPAAWSVAVAAAIPGAPHSLTLQVTNTGATTLQGASREKTIGPSSVRYGFSFTVPIGSRWSRLLTPVADTRATTADATLVQIRQFDYSPRTITIRVGDSVEWLNVDPVGHTATAIDGSWDSGMLGEGERYARVFNQPGRYEYYCIPHPDMRGRVIVEE